MKGEKKNGRPPLLQEEGKKQKSSRISRSEAVFERLRAGWDQQLYSMPPRIISLLQFPFRATIQFMQKSSQ